MCVGNEPLAPVLPMEQGWGVCGKGDALQRQGLGGLRTVEARAELTLLMGQRKPRSPVTGASVNPRPLLPHLYNGRSRAQPPRVES